MKLAYYSRRWNLLEFWHVILYQAIKKKNPELQYFVQQMQLVVKK
jgi:hypothetical protein